MPLPSFQIQDFFCLQPVDDSQDIKNGLSNSRILPILFDLEFTHLGRPNPGRRFPNGTCLAIDRITIVSLFLLLRDPSPVPFSFFGLIRQNIFGSLDHP